LTSQTFRSDLVALRFALLDLGGDSPRAAFEKKRDVAKASLAALASSSDEKSIVARKRILLALARARSGTDQFEQRLDAIRDCRQLIEAGKLEEIDRQQYAIEVLTAEQLICLQRALGATPQLKLQLAKQALDNAEAVVQLAKNLEEQHQQVVCCSPNDDPPNTHLEERQRLDALKMIAPAACDAVYVLTILGALKTSYPADYEKGRQRVAALWTAELKASGAPSADQRKVYDEHF
jgi:hypothetical protein